MMGKSTKLAIFSLLTLLMEENAAKADPKLVELVKENVTPIMRNDIDIDRMSKDTPFCRGFSEPKVISTWVVSTFMLYTYNTYSALQSAGKVKDCSSVDAYAKRSEGINANFANREQRHKTVTDLFITTCFHNGKELQTKIFEGARRAASTMTCQSYGDLSAEILTNVRNFPAQ